MNRVTSLTRLAFSLATFLLLNVVHSQLLKCSKTCITKNCNGMGIRYGKYCGIGYIGCHGEEPCDDLDTCCMHHDKCVIVKGMTYINCHKEFQRCVRELSNTVKQSNNQMVGFSTQCPYSTVIPTVYKGMDLGIFFSGIANLIIAPARGRGSLVEVDLAKSKADTKDGLGTTKCHITKEGSKVFASTSPYHF